MQVSWFTIVAQIINFVVLMVLLRRFLYGPIIETMDARQQEIAKRFEQAEAAREEAEAERERYESERAALEETREEKLAQAEEQARERRQQLLEQARKEVEAQQSRWKQELVEAQEAFLHRMRRQIGQQGVEIARRLLTRLADADLESQIVERFTQQLDTLSQEACQELCESLDTVSEIVLESAFVLSDGQRETVREALSRQIDQELPEFEFRQKEELIAGLAMHVDGWRMTWTIEDYLEDIEDRVMTMIEEQNEGVPE